MVRADDRAVVELGAPSCQHRGGRVPGLHGWHAQRLELPRLAVFEQAPNPGVFERDAIAAAERREAHPIESDEAPLCAEPQVAVVRLQDGEDGGLWQTLLHLLDPMNVLRQRAAGVKAERRKGHHERGDARSEGDSP